MIHIGLIPEPQILFIMKTPILLVLVLLIFSSCSVEDISNEELEQNSNFDRSYYKTCLTTRLMAGQHQEAGLVTVGTDGLNILITYTTYRNWTIDATHLSIGSCDDGSIPTNNSGNPQIGQFEYSETHEDGTHKVTYSISKKSLPTNFCFAAHAEVSGPTRSETAWAEGFDFGGDSWAMYVEATQKNCGKIIE